MNLWTTSTPIHNQGVVMLQIDWELNLFSDSIRRDILDSIADKPTDGVSLSQLHEVRVENMKRFPPLHSPHSYVALVQVQISGNAESASTIANYQTNEELKTTDFRPVWVGKQYFSPPKWNIGAERSFTISILHVLLASKHLSISFLLRWRNCCLLALKQKK